MTSVGILIVEKNGNIKPLMWKKFIEDDIYKKAGFKNSQSFELQTTFKTSSINNKLKTQYIIDVYGKKEGRANQENKYEFPPPIDNVLFFGSCILISRDNDNNPITLKENDWEKIYEALYGGFEDIGNDNDDDDDEKEDEDLPRTSTGYVKDDFVIDDGEFGDDDYLECSSELSEDEFI